MPEQLHESALAPYSPADLRGERVLVLAPHPDDETFGCGGAIALHRKAGDRVRVAFVTSGQQGDWTGSRSAGETALAREAEAGRALAELAVDEWEMWRLADRGVAADGELVERVHDALKRADPTLVYAPSPLELHPDHRAVAHALRAAVRGWPGELSIAWYECSVPLPAPTALVDVGPAWEHKLRAMKRYASQIDGPHDYLGVAEAMAVQRALTLGPDVKRAEAFRVTPLAEVDADPIWRWAALQEPPPPAGTPAVAVVVRTRDRPSQLRDALDSLAAQAFRDFEVVVVNDAGADIVPVIAEYPMLRVRHVRLDVRRGRGAAANAGVAASAAPLVAYLDDDDVFHPEHLALLCGVLQSHPEFGAAYADVDVARFHFNDASQRYELSSRAPEFAGDVDADRLLYENAIPNVALVHRRELWERVGGFDEQLELLEDWDFALRLASEALFVHVGRRTSEYRIREGASISTRRPWGRGDEQRLRESIFERHRERFAPEAQLRVFEALKHRASDATLDAARLRHRVAELEGELERARAEAGRALPHPDLQPLRADLARCERRIAELSAALAEERERAGGSESLRDDRAVSASAGSAPASGVGAPASPGSASASGVGAPASGAGGPARAAARRVGGAIRHPGRAARWSLVAIRRPRAAWRRLSGRG